MYYKFKPGDIIYCGPINQEPSAIGEILRIEGEDYVIDWNDDNTNDNVYNYIETVNEYCRLATENEIILFGARK